MKTNSKSGVVLITVMIFSALATIAARGLMLESSSQLKTANRQVNMEQSFYVAEGGAERAVTYIRNGGVVPGTLTGSIGVITQFPNIAGLTERFNIKVETIKSGKLKDAGNMFRDMTPEDRSYWQALIDQVYLQFVSAIAEARSIPVAKVREFADGRILTGEQAKKLGLIDELGSFQGAIDLAKKEAGLKGEPRLVYPPDDRGRFFEELLGSAVRTLADSIRAEIRRETTMHGEGPGVYYLAR